MKHTYGLFFTLLLGIFLSPLAACQSTTSSSSALASSSSLSSLVSSEEDKTQVTLKEGTIKGNYLEDSNVLEYKGIPFAAPPVGDLRWRSAQDPTPWEGVKDCTKYGNNAMQVQQEGGAYGYEYLVEGSKDKTAVYSEDCLYLNVWTENKDNASAKKPVIVFIHGGGYIGGGGSAEVYSGKEICKQGVVFLNINYRLGIFGYFATSDLLKEDEASGNYALTDQLKALEWVQNNIAKFGGDKNNVTIMGQSAGSGSVDGLICCKKSKGLFQHAVCCSLESITKLCTWNDIATRKANGDKIQGNLSLKEIRALTAKNVLRVNYTGGNGPCIDGNYIEENMANSILHGKMVDVDVMTGFCHDDEFFSYNSDPFLLYSYEKDKSRDGMMSIQNLIGALHKKAGTYTKNVYIYDYAHKHPRLEHPLHTTDLEFWFNDLQASKDEPWREEDYKLAKEMSARLVSFALNGSPNATNLVNWTISEGNFDYMMLDNTSYMYQMSAEVIEKAKSDFADYYAYLG